MALTAHPWFKCVLPVITVILAVPLLFPAVMCTSVSSALKDKCLRSEGSHSAAPPLNPGGVMLSQTMELFLHLPQSLLSLLSCRQSNSCVSGKNLLSLDLTTVFIQTPCKQADTPLPPLPPPGPAGLLPSRWALQRQTVSLLLASVQMSTVWVVSKAYQFLSSWSPKKFLLISQGDLRVGPLLHIKLGTAYQTAS